ncbi:MAG: CRISPR-associated endonuclease Cas2, partial [Nitrososphaerota archaeon]|nr:CRISPR-associated endonuclease Cas2 [Nitrososphaerota archaeon]
VFRILNQRLSRVQLSVFAGPLSKQECAELRNDLEKLLDQGACLMWVFDRQVEPWLVGMQTDKEVNIL